MNFHLFPKFHSLLVMKVSELDDLRGRDMVETCRRLRDFIILAYRDMGKNMSVLISQQRNCPRTALLLSFQIKFNI